MFLWYVVFCQYWASPHTPSALALQAYSIGHLTPSALALHVYRGVCIHWTGPLDWTTGLDYWTGKSRPKPGLAKRRKEKIQHVMECFDYPNCVRESVTVQKGSKFSSSNITYPIWNPMLAIIAIFVFIIVYQLISLLLTIFVNISPYLH